ncbi:hypothetical protein EBR78_10815 [bacterium]|nr:hypothetical protein [bacterium]
MAAEGVVVGLSGLGADELFGGYPTFDRAPRWSRLLRGLQFIVDDPFWAIKTQCDYLAWHGSILPIAVSYSGPEAESYGSTWKSFNFGHRIFYSSTVTPEIISRACNAKGYVSVFQPASRLSVPYGVEIDHAIFGRLSMMALPQT